LNIEVHQRFAVHHLDEERLACRNIERVRDAQRRRQRNDLPHANPARKGQPGEQKRLQHHRGLRRDHDSLAIAPVGHDPAQRRQQEHRNLARETDRAEQQ
jgi:hypothetical protein